LSPSRNFPPPACFGTHAVFPSTFFPPPAINREDLLAPFFVEGRAAHPFLHVMGSPIGVLDNSHHHIVVLRDQHIARCYVDLSLVDLRARLIETLFDVAQIEYHIIASGLADDTNDLALLDLETVARVALDQRLTDDFHVIGPLTAFNFKFCKLPAGIHAGPHRILTIWRGSSLQRLSASRPR